MKDRISIVGKWEDTWFMELPPNSKLVFTYVCDKCDGAGIIEFNSRIWPVHIGLTKEQVTEALKPLQSKLISDKKSKLWVKTHLFWQGYLPLHKGIEEHDWIINRLISNFEKFGSPKEISDILKNVVEPVKNEPAKKRATGERFRFVAPSYEQFRDYYVSQDENVEVDNIKALFDHYVSVGWKVGAGSKQMKDWEASIRNAIRRAKNGKKGYKGMERTSTAMSVASKFVKNEEK